MCSGIPLYETSRVELLYQILSVLVFRKCAVELLKYYQMASFSSAFLHFDRIYFSVAFGSGVSKLPIFLSD